MRYRFTTRRITRSRSYTTGCLSRPILGMSSGLQSRDRSLHSAIGSRLARHHRVVTVEKRKHPWIDATAPPTVFGGRLTDPEKDTEGWPGFTLFSQLSCSLGDVFWEAQRHRTHCPV